MKMLDKHTLTAISNNGAFVFSGADGTEDLDTGLQLLDFTATLIEEMSDLHLISQVALGSQLRQIEMMLKVGLTLAEDKIEYLGKQLQESREALADD